MPKTYLPSAAIKDFQERLGEKYLQDPSHCIQVQTEVTDGQGYITLTLVEDEHVITELLNESLAKYPTAVKET